MTGGNESTSCQNYQGSASSDWPERGKKWRVRIPSTVGDKLRVW